MTDDVLTFPAPAGTTGPEALRNPGQTGRMGWRKRLMYPLRWSPPGFAGPVDLRLLLFLVLFLNVKLAVKVPVLAVACLLQPDFWEILRLRQTRIPLFYPMILALAVLDWVLFQGLGNLKYDLVAGNAVLFWAACWAASFAVSRFADQSDAETLHRTLTLFFLLNALVSLLNLLRIEWDIKSLNPYLYQGMYQKYFIRTGDFIKGITFDTSTTNALINGFGVIYFLTRKRGWMMIACMACLLATGSNFTNILMLGIFAFLFLFRTDREQKGGILLCLLMGAVFLAKVSPQNQAYTEETFDRWKAKWTVPPVAVPVQAWTHVLPPDSMRIVEAIERLKALPLPKEHWSPKSTVPVPDINTDPYQSRPDTTPEQRALIAFTDAHRSDLHFAIQPDLPYGGKVPGKILALWQIASFYRAHPFRILAGAGPGNFSSKLAFRATGLGMAGGYPARLTYIHPEFLRHHLDLYLAYFSKPKEVHSLVNSPDSVYGQMLGEYGIVGCCVLLGFYVGFFLKRSMRRSYSVPLLMLLAASFFVGYWFEQLSIVVLFELMVFTDWATFKTGTAS